MAYSLNDYFNNRDYKLWDYIEFNLYQKGIKIDDLKDIFDVSSTTIANWKKGESISREKKVFLAKMFGVSLDQFYDRVDSNINDWFYRLGIIDDPKRHKNLRDRDLDIMFEAAAKIGWYIEQVLDNKEPYNEVTPNEFDYFCQHLQVSYEYELIDKKVPGESYLNSNILVNINEELKKSWGNNADLKQKLHYKTRDLIEILLRSESIKYISKFVSSDVENTKYNKLPVYLNPKKYLERYSNIKSKLKDFDENGDVLKALIGEGIVFWSDDKPDYEKTFKYLQTVIRHEIYDKYIEEEM